MRYLMIDRITEIKYGSYALGTKCISVSEDYFEHHFPMHPIYPGALTIESLAQLSGWLINSTLIRKMNSSGMAVLIKVENMKFLDPVIPGDRLDLRAEISEILDTAAYVNVEARVEQNLVARGLLMFLIAPVNADQMSSMDSYFGVISKNMRVID